MQTTLTLLKAQQKMEGRERCCSSSLAWAFLSHGIPIPQLPLQFHPQFSPSFFPNRPELIDKVDKYLSEMN